MAKKHILYCLILIISGLALRIAIVAYHNFDGLYGQDAYAYYDFSLDLMNFVRTREAPPPFAWSMGYPLILAGTFFVLEASETLGLLINILMGTLVPVLVYSISIQFKLRPLFAFCTGLLIIASGQILQSSMVMMSDIPALFAGLLSIICFLQYLHTRRIIWLLGCAFTVSFAVNIRLIYAILPPLYIVIHLLRLESKRHVLDIFVAIPFALIPQIPQLVYNRYNPTNLLDHAWVEGWSVANFFSKDFVNIDGTFSYASINTAFYARPIYEITYLSPLLTLFVVIGFVILIRKKIAHHSLLLIGWILLPYLFLSGIPYQNIRFPLIFFPAIATLIGLSLQAIFDSKHQFRWLLLFVGLVGFIHTGITGIDYANSFIGKHQADKAVVTWIQGNIPDDATLYTFGSTLTLQHYTDYNIIELYYETPNTLNQRWFRGQTDYVLLNVWQIENQWQDREPQANYHWFRDERGLTEIGRFRNDTLFEASE